MDQQIQLGKYRLYHHLASGGMGEVFLARHEGPAGFAKNVVVKRILGGIASDETFVTMFLNEARLAAMIEHPNVVQIFDLGLEGDTYFIAMEYIHGRSLRQVRRRLAELKRAFPSVLAARICSQVLQGLHYAHTLSDEHGQPLQIVHRDVSPDNVLIGFNGVTKVVDFGIAKAAVNVSTTRAGAVKGKFAYMAPEQITGKAAGRPRRRLRHRRAAVRAALGTAPLPRHLRAGAHPGHPPGAGHPGPRGQSGNPRAPERRDHARRSPATRRSASPPPRRCPSRSRRTSSRPARRSPAPTCRRC